MVHHTPSAKAEAENVSVFFPPCSSILWVLCDQYGCDPLVWLLIQWCINLTHVPKDGLTAVSTPVWIVGAHGTSYTIQGRWWKCPSFHPSTHGTSFDCMTSMDVIPLCVCLCYGVSTSLMHPLMNWERCQYLYWLLEIMVYHTSSKAEDESAPVFIYPPMVYHVGVVWPVLMWSPCLVACTMVDQLHMSTYW